MSVDLGQVRTAAQGRASRRDWLGLLVLALAVLLISVDATVLDIALSFISADLAPSSGQLLWIVDVYSFVLAGLLVTMGTLGDRIGRRRLLLIGAAGFALASALAAFATTPAMLIGARVLQGVSGATLMPATLGLLRSMFADAGQRRTAIGIWSAMAGGGAAAGPLVGGWLLEHFWWGSVFLVNLPVMALLLLAAPSVIPEFRDPRPGRFDLVSAALSMLAVLPIVYAIKEIAVHGVSPVRVLAIGVGLAAGTTFVRRQRRLDDPLIDLDLLRSRVFSTAVLTNLLSIFALGGALFFCSQYLQLVLGRSPLQAGVLMLPETAASALTALAAAPLARRWRPGAVLATALALAALGALLLVGLRTEGTVGLYIAGSLLIGVGVGVSLTLTSDLVVGAVPPQRAGAASAVSETAYELGLALGVAVLGSLVMAVFRGGIDVGGLSPAAADAARESLGEALATAAHSPVAETVVESANHAFVSGVNIAAAVIAALLAAAAVLVAVRLRRE